MYRCITGLRIFWALPVLFALHSARIFYRTALCPSSSGVFDNFLRGRPVPVWAVPGTPSVVELLPSELQPVKSSEATAVKHKKVAWPPVVNLSRSR